MAVETCDAGSRRSASPRLEAYATLHPVAPSALKITASLS
jgi:hypothetical protein